MPTLLVEIFGRRMIAEISGRIIVGRSAISEVRVKDRSVSRIHAWIAGDGNTFYLNDAGSRFGSRVNGQLIHGRIKLKDGDQIRIGPAKLRFREKMTIPPGFELIDLEDARQQRTEDFVDCKCGAPLLVPWDYAGEVGRCRHCGNHVDGPAINQGQDPSLAGKLGTATGTCAACHSEILVGEASTSCSDCGVTFHANCWTENLGCSSYGCKQVGILDAASHELVLEESDSTSLEDFDFFESSSLRSIDWSYPMLAVALGSSVAGLLAFGIPPAICLIAIIGYRLKAGPRMQRGLFVASTAIALLATGAGAAFSWYWWVAGRAGVRFALL